MGRLDVAEVLDVDGEEPQGQILMGITTAVNWVALSLAGLTTPGERSSASSTSTSCAATPSSAAIAPSTSIR